MHSSVCPVYAFLRRFPRRLRIYPDQWRPPVPSTAARWACGICAKETESEMDRADAGHPALRSAADLDNVTASIAATMAWRRSSWCSSSSCLEFVNLPGGGVAVRDSKQPISAPVLVFGAHEWNEFVSGVSDGEFG